MGQAARDQNYIPTTLAWDGTTTSPLEVDTSTGRLLVEIIAVSASTPSGVVRVNDENRVAVALAVTDDVAATVSPLIVDSRNGYLFVDLLIE